MNIREKAENMLSPKVDETLLDQAKDLGLDVAQIPDDQLHTAISQTKSSLWQKENALAIQASNKWVEENGVPLAKYRSF